MSFSYILERISVLELEYNSAVCSSHKKHIMNEIYKYERMIERKSSS